MVFKFYIWLFTWAHIWEKYLFHKLDCDYLPAQHSSEPVVYEVIHVPLISLAFRYFEPEVFDSVFLVCKNDFFVLCL